MRIASKASVLAAGQRSFLWLALAACGTLLNQANQPLPLIAWLVPFFTLRFMRGRGPLAGYCWLSLVSMGAAWKMAGSGLIPFSGGVLVGIVVGGSLIGSLPYLADRLLAGRVPLWAASLVFPLAFTGLEYLAVGSAEWGSFGSLAYTQYSNLALVQVVSLTGLWGLTFLITWGASTASQLWERGWVFRPARLAGLSFAGVLAVAILWGQVRLQRASGPVDSVSVAAFTAFDSRAGLVGDWGDKIQELGWDGFLADPDQHAAFRALCLDVRQRYFAGTQKLAEAGAQLVLWPEGAGIGLAGDEVDLIAGGRQLALEYSIYLAMPLATLYPGQERPPENKMLLISPQGTVEWQHVKFGGNAFEGTLLGDGELLTHASPFGTISGAICWDMDFPAVISQAGRNGTDLLLAPAADFKGVHPIHGQMAVFRAVENGVNLLRQADNGLSLATDSYGRVVAQMDHFRAGERVLWAQVPTKGVWTLYPVVGDVVGWGAAVGFVGLVGLVLVRKRRLRLRAEPRAPQRQPIKETTLAG
ncbi:MAG: hypothetical protein GKR89_16085 [Candidatus Latescibacteria bacterium]|nr:hypothetical protein [Candidatus Latescibacterota bacterium]